MFRSDDVFCPPGDLKQRSGRNTSETWPRRETLPFDHRPDAPQRIAIIGGGISGMAAARALAECHQVTLFEAAPGFGGHARTVLAGRRGDQPVDTGFIVFNYVNYPHLTGLFRDLDVPVQPSDMSFGVSLRDGALEYALRSGDALFAQRRNLLRPGFWGMLRDIFRFNARAFKAAADAPDLTIAELLDSLKLGRAFREEYLYPICGAIWSTPREGIGEFPAGALIRFMRNHALMQARGRHGWWTVSGGSREYVSRLTADLARRGVRLRPGTPVAAVRRCQGGVELRPTGGAAEPFDQVIFACAADQALRLLKDARPDEARALSAVRFQDNRTVLHADPSVMPKNRRCWSSWVYCERSGDDPGVGVTYWMNRLQSIDASDPLFVSLNPGARIDPGLIYDEHVFRHPVFDKAALAAQQSLQDLQGRDGIWFAGAWLRNGFHEDGFASAMRIARRLARAKPVLSGSA